MIKIKNAGTHKKNNNQINFDFAFENSVRSRIATTVGLKTQQYIAICARPGVGKSWLAQNLIVDILSEMDENALYVSFEMSIKQLDKRFKLSYSDLYEDEIANHLNVIDEMITPEEL